jgi:prolyl-tRNA synthetase
LGEAEQNQVKTLMYIADDELIAVVLRGDRELNEIKLQHALQCNQLYMADEARVRDVCGAGFGSLGPVGMKIKVYADREVAHMKNFSCGANVDDYHLRNVNAGRDFTPTAWLDLRNAVEGDSCPLCSGRLQAVRGIEVGHIFKLGTKYSDALQASYRDQDGTEKPMVMGCYGIGVSRTMAAAVEQNYDENGIIWPVPIAPYSLIIVPVNSQKEEQMKLATDLYEEFLRRGVEVILDDRDERPGVKFKDADLIGIPLRITIGPKSMQDNQVEVKKRWEKDNLLVARDEVIDYVMASLKSNNLP